MKLQARACLIGAALAAMSLAAAGQDESSLAGTWFGIAKLPGGQQEAEVRMEVEGASGTFKMTPRVRLSSENQCYGKPLPIGVKVTGPGAYRIHIQASQAIPGCKDGMATLALTDPQHLDGKFGDGRPLKLKKH